MLIHTERKRPSPWSHYRAQAKHAALVPFHSVEWFCRWLAYWLSGWALLEVLEYVGTLSVLIAVISYFAESGDRTKQKHYQAWQVINTAHHTSGSGGRIEALAELNADGVPLVGVDVSSAFLQGVQLPKARLLRANFTAADVRNSNLSGADLSYASLNGANFRQSDLSHASLDSADLTDADFCGARFVSSDLSGVTFDGADLGNADLSAIQWQQIKSVKKTNLAGVKNVPEGFLPWALKNGAVQLETNPSCPMGGGNP